MKKKLWHGIVIGMICTASVGCSFAHKEETMPDTAVRVENLRIDNYFVQGRSRRAHGDLQSCRVRLVSVADL